MADGLVADEVMESTPAGSTEQPSAAEAPAEQAPVDTSTANNEPPLQNKVGELERRLARAEERALAAETSKTETTESLKQSIVNALTDRQSETTPDVTTSPDVFQDQAAHDAWVANTAKAQAEAVTAEQLEQFKAEQEASNREAMRRERSTRSVEEFKANKDWLADPERDAEFAKFVNERIAPTGEDFSLTVEDLENAELLFRKDEILAERASEGRNDAVRTIMNRQNREPAARVSTESFADQTPAEQAEAIMSSDQATGERLLSQLDDGKLMRVLELIDPDTQPLR